MRVAIIPARGGSKRIPRKNIRPFGGRPMIAWSIDAALQSGCFDRVIVSTDDAEIADVAQAAGASVPFLRPPELSDDHTGTIPVVAHAVQWHVDAGQAPTQITYRGQADRLFKRDFGKLFHDNFDVQVVDYGFLWGTEFDAAGFDNINWWLFEKRQPLAVRA